MAKKITFLMVFFLSSISFSATASNCPQGAATNSPGFCSAFKLAAQCHCTASGIPKGMCINMRSLYDRMISIFGSVRRACEYQRDTSMQNCLDSWSCYRAGGTNSDNQLCSGTGSACE